MVVQPRRPEVIDEVFEGEAVLVQLRTGCYYALNPAASAIWALLGPGRSAAGVAAALGCDPEVVAAFLTRLEAETLVEAAAAEAPAPSDAELTGVDRGTPDFERFTDMQDILMLDPIHDIDLDGDGWPVAAA